MPSKPSPSRGALLGRHVRRRPLLAAAVSGGAAVTGISLAVRMGADQEAPSAAGGTLVLAGGGDLGVESLHLPLDRDVLERTGPRQWASRRLPTSTYSMVAFTWTQGGPEPHIEIRLRKAGSWQPWQPAPHVHESVEDGSSRETSTVGTEPAWVGVADGIELRVGGALPLGLQMVLLHPTAKPGDSARAPLAARSSARGSTDQQQDRVPRPVLRSRQDWGADPALRDGRPEHVETIKQVHVHHTANSNDYSREDVPAVIRGIYAYHTQSLGWSDIGYNFLVDRFGRIWVGRAGGASRPVRGAHTLGFNATSTGVAAIGNYDAASPPEVLIGGIAQLAAWKLDMYGRDPMGRTTVRSEGSDKYPAGRSVTLPVIDGHRDTNDTACPGGELYAALPRVRRRTKAIMDRYPQDREATITEAFRGEGTAISGETLSVQPGAWTPADAEPRYQWMRDGNPIQDATGSHHQLGTADVGSLMSARVTVDGPDIKPATQVVEFPDAVRARTELAVRAAGRRKRAMVAVTASAPGHDGPVEGSVTITLAGRTRTVELVDDRATTIFRGLAPGDYAAQVSYPGSQQASPATGSDRVTVKPND